ncbi:DUF6603 domain-containing protein [Streptomyces sp. x-19]|uniref:DUF6603 domain-containing protein n=1 Tax=Streptomyces sp. x-19 TaxID=2789280 RepID=UPI00397EE456
MNGDLVVKWPFNFNDRDLTVTGSVPLDGVGLVTDAEVSFVAADEGWVGGVMLAATLSRWEVATAYLRVNLEGFQGHGFDSPLLVLGATPPSPVGGEVTSWASSAVGFSVGPVRTFLFVSSVPETGGFELSGAFPLGLGLMKLEDLARLPMVAGVEGEEFSLPAGVPLLGSIGWLEIRAGFNPTRGGIEWMWLDAGLGSGRWDPVGDWLALEGLSVRYGIGWYSFGDTPGEDSRRHLVSQELNADVIVRGTTMRARVTLPDMIITASLQDPADVSDIIGDRLADVLPDVRVSSLFLGGRLDNKSYTVSCSLDTRWTFFEGLTLEGVSFHLDGLGGAPDLFSITGSFDIGGTAVYVEARRASAGGWMLSVLAEDLEFSGFCDWLKDSFPGVRVPEAVAGMKLARVALMFEPSTRTFMASCTGSLPLGEREVLLDLNLQARAAQDGFEAGFWGELSLPVLLAEPDEGEEEPVPTWMRFTLGLERDPLSTRLGASWSTDDADGMPVLALVRALGLTDEALTKVLPEAWWPRVRRAGIAYDSASGGLVLALATQYMGVTAATVKDGGRRLYALLLRGNTDLRASRLPIVGQAVVPGGDFVIRGVEFCLASAAWNPAQAQAANDLLRLVDSAQRTDVPSFEAAGVPSGAGLALYFEAAGEPPSRLLVPLTGSSSLPQSAAVAPRSVGSTIEIGLAAGPVRVHRITLAFTGDAVLVGLDLTVAVGPIELTVIGLGARVGTDFAVSPLVQGALVFMSKPPVLLAGTLTRRSHPDYDEYVTGGVVVETGIFGLQAVGSYARSPQGWTSFFLFGEAASRNGIGLFGPPPFTVTGLAVGFGVNSTVRVPTLSQVPTFPLVRRLSSSGSPEDPLQQLESWVTPKQGQYWGAGGITFTSFRFIETRALLLVEGGEQWNVTLLGRTSVSLPRNRAAEQRPIAQVNIDLVIAYRQAMGLLSLDAVIAPGSFVLDPGFTLTGGISMYVWTGGEHAGDFAITAGGYHPWYKVHGHLPQAPDRVGFSWSPSSSIQATGNVYAAVTSNALMFGGRLAFDYAAGGAIHLQAWLNAHLDVLVQWKPFYLTASLGVRVGAAATIKVLFVRVRVSVEVGVELDLWTPPLGGRATVKLWFVSFTFSFGSSRNTTPAADWPETRTQLPSPTHITLEQGLLPDVPAEEAQRRAAVDKPVLVSAEGFTLAIQTQIPLTLLTVNGTPYTHPDTGAPDYGALPSVRPMRTADITCEQHITVTKDGQHFTPQDQGWTVEPIIADLPRALWGPVLKKPADALDEPAMLAQRVTGLRITVPPPVTGDTTGPATARALGTQTLAPGATPLRNPAAQGPRPTTNPRTIAVITDPTTGISTDTTHTHRTRLHTLLHQHHYAPGTNTNPIAYTTQAPSIHTHPPLTTSPG